MRKFSTVLQTSALGGPTMSTSGARKLISGKNHVKISTQSELRISGNIRNGFWPDLGMRNRREHRGTSNLGGAPAPPPPWRPWTRGELSSHLGGGQGRRRRRGALSPSLPVAPECRRGKDLTAIYIKNLATINTNSLPLFAAV